MGSFNSSNRVSASANCSRASGNFGLGQMPAGFHDRCAGIFDLCVAGQEQPSRLRLKYLARVHSWDVFGRQLAGDDAQNAVGEAQLAGVVEFFRKLAGRWAACQASV